MPSKAKDSASSLTLSKITILKCSFFYTMLQRCGGGGGGGEHFISKTEWGETYKMMSSTLLPTSLSLPAPPPLPPWVGCWPLMLGFYFMYVFDPYLNKQMYHQKRSGHDHPVRSFFFFAFFIAFFCFVYLVPSCPRCPYLFKFWLLFLAGGNTI